MQAIYLTREWVNQTLPRRAKSAHKGSFGTLNILAGAQRYRGAAVLCAAAALRAGAGIVRLCATEAVCSAVAAQQPCVVLQPVREGISGGIAAEGAGLALATKPTALLAGCGMGATAETALLTAALLRGAACPLVLDADALNALAGHTENGENPAQRTRLLALLAGRTAPTVLTPHVGEMARLAAVPVQDITTSPAEQAAAFAQKYHCTLVLKNSTTCIATPGGEVYWNESTGNPGLATGGSGDVLAGIIASLCAQHLAPEVAAPTGVWLHGAAADLAAGEYGFAGLSPGDLPVYLAKLLHSMNR